jgi:hypothetical protein
MPATLTKKQRSAAWLRGADASHREERFQEEPRNPYKKGSPRHAAREQGYREWGVGDDSGGHCASRNQGQGD